MALEDVRDIFVANSWSTSTTNFGGRIAFDREGLLYLTVGERQEQTALKKDLSQQQQRRRRKRERSFLSAVLFLTFTDSEIKQAFPIESDPSTKVLSSMCSMSSPRRCLERPPGPCP
jgi:hypothetical protein